MRLFHYHLASALVRRLESTYMERGFELVARFGRVGSDQVSFDAGRDWSELDELGFTLRLTQLERDGVEVVVQPGRSQEPLVDHVGVLLDDAAFAAVLDRAAARGLAVQKRGGRRTFVSTGAVLRLELRHDDGGEVGRLRLDVAAAEPARQADGLASLLGLEAADATLSIGGSTIRFLPDGPAGRPRLVADRDKLDCRQEWSRGAAPADPTP
jgi:hypothetical protein